MSLPDDEQLLSMVRAGNVDGIAGLFDRHGKHCLSNAGLLLGEDGSAEDVVFAVFLELWRQPPSGQVGAMRAILVEQTRQTAGRRRQADSEPPAGVGARTD